MASPYRISEETLGMSSIQRGLPGMVSKVQPGPNMFDGGAASKSAVNTQPSNNERYKLQEVSRNIESAAPQAAADATRRVGSQIDMQSNAENKAKQFAAERMSEVLYANDSGSALMRLNAVMQSPEKDRVLQNLATGKAMAAGINPDLGAQSAEASRYLG
jgi:hypothetical protein